MSSEQKALDDISETSDSKTEDIGYEGLDEKIKQTAQTFYSPTIGWSFDKLDNLVDNFIDYRGKTPPKSEEGIPLLSAANIKNGFILPMRKEKYITEETYEEWTTRGIPSEGDVVVTTEAPVGEVGMIRTKEKYLTSQRLITMRTGENLDSRYLKFCLQYQRSQKQLESYASGTTVDSFNQTDLRNTVIPLPPLSEQEKIGEILNQIELKIKVNKRISNNLEEISEALFKSWFDNFQPYDDFKDTEIGKIPKDFTVENLTDIAEVTYGYSFDSEHFNEKGEGSPVIRIRDLEKSKTGKFSPEEYEEKYHITPGDVLVRMDRLFRSHIWKGPEGGLNQRVCKFESEKELCSNMFLYLALKKPLAKLEASKTGTTVIHLGKKDIDSIKIAYPDSNSLRKFNNITQPIYAEIVRREEENRELKAVRNTLLPKLMSGEIRVNFDGDE